MFETFSEERYDYAKKLKVTIADLQKVGEKLGKYEVEKRQAVENEDYDKAKLKKIQMDEYRLQVYQELEIHDLLETDGVRHFIIVLYVKIFHFIILSRAREPGSPAKSVSQAYGQHGPTL